MSPKSTSENKALAARPGLILIATKNGHKAGELGVLLSSLGSGTFAVTDLRDWEAAGGTLDEPEEGAESFVDNAVAKAVYYARATSLPALADDSGLSVAALNGAPGVLSARYGGPALDDGGRCDLLLEELDGIQDRRAYFTSILALARPDGAALHWAGRVEGLISREKRGQGGFGYDPLFYYPPARLTLAEMSPEKKNSLSHRARAAEKFKADGGRVLSFLGLSPSV